MSKRPFFISTFFFLLFFILQQYAFAEDSAGVVILSLHSCCEHHAWADAETNVQKELELLDIPVAKRNAVSATEPDTNELLVRIAEKMHADAALMIFVLPGEPLRAGVRIYDRVTKKIVIKTWPIKSTTSVDDAMYAGLRVVDTLRASLLEARMEKQVPEPIIRPSKVGKLAVTTALKTKQRKRFSLGIGPTVGWGSSDGPFMEGMETFGNWHPTRYVGVELALTFLPFGKPASKDGVTSDLDVLAVRGWLIWHILDRKISPELRIGGGSLIVFAEGLRSEERPLKSDISPVSYGGVGASVKISITQIFGLRFYADVGLAFPEVQLYHNTTRVLTIGRPLTESGIMLEMLLL